jgi:hypothetical protein
MTGIEGMECVPQLMIMLPALSNHPSILVPCAYFPGSILGGLPLSFGNYPHGP